MPLFDRPPIDAISVSNQLFSSGTFRITGGPAVTVGSDASGATIRAGANLGAWRNFEQQDALMITHLSAISKVPFYFGEQIEGNVTLGNIGFKLSAVTANTNASLDVHFGVYTKVNSTSANLLGSASNNFNLSSASSVSFSAIRNFVLTSPGTVAAISTLPAGDYVFGMMFSAGATQSMNFSLFGAGGSAAISASQPVGVIRPGANQMSTATSQGFQPLMGRGTTVNALPAAISAPMLSNQVSGAAAPLRPWIYLRS